MFNFDRMSGKERSRLSRYELHRLRQKHINRVWLAVTVVALAAIVAALSLQAA